MKAARRVGLWIALASVGLLPATVSAEEHLSDAQLKKMVEEALLDKQIAGVDVEVDAGSVTLEGTVPSAWARDEAERTAMRERDVQSVENELTVARAESDAAIAAEVDRRIQRFVLYSVFDDVHAVVHDADVTLEGSVTMGSKAADIARLASKVPGVRAVHSRIRTLPSSTLDDEVRIEVASHIYDDPLFETYAYRADPPIHVLVEGGHVTLTGTVASSVERLKAELDARDAFGVMGVDNHLQVAS
jgi:hyperosmotically inducible protein